MANASFERLSVKIHEDICRWLIDGSTSFFRNGTYDRDLGIWTVAALARTSRALHEPAANVLWEWIPDVALLIYTLPGDCYRIRDATDDAPTTVSAVSDQC